MTPWKTGSGESLTAGQRQMILAVRHDFFSYSYDVILYEGDWVFSKIILVIFVIYVVVNIVPTYTTRRKWLKNNKTW
jgi:hypothetical protein